jgi:hypothetical protein
LSTAIQYEMRVLLEQHGARIRGRNRADCPKCKRFRTIAFTEETFFCHGIDCGWKGNRITLAKELGVYEKPSQEEYRDLCRRNDAAERLTAAVYARRIALLPWLRLLGWLEATAHDTGPDDPQTWADLELLYREHSAIEADLDFLESAPASQLVQFLEMSA